MKRLIRFPGLWLVLALTWGTIPSLQAQDDNTPNYEQLLGQIERFVSQGNFAQAYQQAHILVAENPEKAEAWFWLGQAACQDHRIREALAAFEKARSLRKEYPEASYQLGKLHAQRGKWREAIAAYHQALQLHSDWGDAYVALSEVYAQNGEYRKALEKLEQALLYEPAHPLALRLVGLCKKAIQEDEQVGAVSAETLEQLAFSSFQGAAPQTQTRDLKLQQPSPSVAVPFHIGFPPGKHTIEDLAPSGRGQLDQTIRLLQTSAWKGKQILIEGHTCRCGTSEKNKSLGYQRATAVRDYLTGQGGVSAQAVSIISYGEEQPLSADGRDDLTPEQCALDEEHSMDQRVVIRLGSGLFVGDPSVQVSCWSRRKTETKFQRLTEGATLHSGDEIKLFLFSQKTLHAYIFHRGPKGDWTCLFPNPDFCLEAPPTNPIEPARQYWLPRFGSGAPLDDTPGLESIFVYLSPTADLEMEKWVREDMPGGTLQPGARGLARVVVPESMEWFAQIHFHHEP